MTFRIGTRHWVVFALLFLVQMLGLALTVLRNGSGFDQRTILLMVACSALMAAITTLVIVGLFDKAFRTSK